MADHPRNLTRTAVYLRKSRADIEAETRGEGETLSKHRRTLLALANKYDYTILDVYEEVVSGESIFERPEVQRMLHAVQNDHYDAVLCMDVDRLGRGNQIDQGIIQETFREASTLIITPRKAYDLTDELDEEWSEFESFMARRELKIITRRLQRGRQQSVADGRSISSRPPFGYLRDAENKLIPDPQTAPLVQMIFAWAADGWGRTRICRRLTEMGIPSPRGHAHWDVSTMAHLLTNPAYLGHLRWNHLRRRKKNGHLFKVIQPDHAQIWKRNAHDPIIDEDLFRLVQERQTRHLPVGVHKPVANSLAGLVVCAKCGRKMARVPNKPKAPQLRCKTFGCATRSARLVDVETVVIQSLYALLPSLEATAEHRRGDNKKTNETTRVQQEIETLKNGIKTADGQRARLHDLLEQGVYDVDTFVLRNHELGEKLNSLRQQLATAQERQVHANKALPTSDAILNALQVYQESATPAQKQKILSQIVDHIDYTRETTWTEVGHFELDIHLRV